MKIDILYSGQIRYVESIERHNEFFSSINADRYLSMLGYIQNTMYDLNEYSSCSFNPNTTIEESRNFLINNTKPIYEKTYTRIEMIESINKIGRDDLYSIFYLQHLFSFVSGLAHTTGDCVICTTTDIVIEGDLNDLTKEVKNDISKVFIKINPSNGLVNPWLFVLNKPAKDAIIEKGMALISTIFDRYDQEQTNKSECAWENLFKDCGIEIVHLNFFQMAKIYPNMSLDDIKKESVSVISKKRSDFVNFKDKLTDSYKKPKKKNLSLITNINRIVSYGCSYTAGDEFLDEEMHPGAEEIKRKSMDKWFDVKSTISQATLNLYYQRQKNMAWPAILAKKLNAEILNKAIGGNSLSNMLCQLEYDFANNEIKDTDLVVIGLTGFERSVYFDLEESRPVLMASARNFPNNLKAFQGPIAEFNNSMFMFFLYYITLSRFIQVGRTLLKNKFLIVPCMNAPNYRDYVFEHKDYFRKTVDNLKISCLTAPEMLTDLDIYDFISNKKVDLHSGGHPKVYVHEKFVEHLYTKLKPRLQ